MRTLSTEDLLVLQRDPHHIRNICVLAHVDHGKTSLADSLVASNGIISQRMVGKLRYLDNRPDEQERGITMKSSAISLHHVVSVTGQSFLINLIDSPGHVDFSGEVSTAVRLCDGAIVVVDVVEGCAPQTVQVLRQAWLENLKPVLVINKIDRLILEKKLTPMEAYQRLVQVLEEINAVTGSLFATEILMKQDVKREEKAKGVGEEENELFDWDAGLEDSDDSSLYFEPEKGNVIFASALDGWGFTIEHFAEIYSQKLGINRQVLRKTLWGDFWLNAKEKKVFGGAHNKGKKPLFVQFVLENLWMVYDAICNRKDKELTDKIVSALGLKIHARDAKQADPKGHVFAVCSQWLPLGKAVLDAVCDKLPSPCDLSSERVEKLISNQRRFDSLPQQTRDLKNDFLRCSGDVSSPAIVFVSKMFPVSPDCISRPSGITKPAGQTLTLEDIAARRERVRQIAVAGRDKVNVAESDFGESHPEAIPSDVFVAFARVFSGCIREGDELYVLSPKHNPETALLMEQNGNAARKLPDHVLRVKIGPIYVMMGREMERVSEASAGNVVGISGLEEHLVRSGTLSSTVACPAFTDLYFMSAPIVRVAVEPKRTGDMEKLIRGLKLLYQADPCVEVFVQETGEHVIVTAGEVHLQRCVEDLTKSFAKIEINVSPPIVPFRETVVVPPKVDMVNENILEQMTSITDAVSRSKTDVVEIRTANKLCCLHIRAVPLPIAASKLLEDNLVTLKALHRFRKNKNVDDDGVGMETLSAELREKIDDLRIEFEKSLTEENWDIGGGPTIPDLMERICSFGPRNCGPNILINCTNLHFPSVWSNEVNEKTQDSVDFSASIITGFQLATLAGPLCEEPMMGVCFVLHKFELAEIAPNNSPGEQEADNRAAYGPLSGQLIPVMKEGCRKSFQLQPQRLMTAMYSCVIQTTGDVLGKVYGVINKRRGRILSDQMQEGSEVFSITTTIPVCESFGFAEEIRKRTSGLALPQLVFSHWEVLDVDPFWIPTTEEEYTHFGDKADAENIARRYMNQVRRRKGLSVEEKLVVHGEKQRTMGRNK